MPLATRYPARLTCIASFWIAFLSLSFVALAQAAPSSDDPVLESILVVGARVPVLLSESTDSISTITREQIVRMNAATGMDLFRQVPGLQIDQLGGPGGLSSVYIRGSDPNHVLVLIDGVRMNDPTNSRGGGFDISNLDPNQIERIEILRGAASAIYGADAMGGVINVVTRRDTEPVSGAASLGGLGYRSFNARASTGSEGFRLATTASLLQDGREGDGGRLELKQFSATANISIKPNAQVDFDLRHSERQSNAFPDDSGGIMFSQLRTLEQRAARDTTLGARGRWDFDELTLNAAATRLERTEVIDSPGVAPGVRSAFGLPASISATEFRRNSLLLNGIFHLAQGSEMVIGVEFQREHGISRTSYALFGKSIPADFDLQRDTRSGFAELKWLAARDLIVRLGLRHDSVDGSGSRTSPSVGVRYNFPTLNSSIRANYSEGFKPPSFFSLGLPVFLGGNPNLRPESNKGIAIGYEQGFWENKVNASISVFDTHYVDLITFDNQNNKLVNANRVNIHGAESELSMQASESVRMRVVFTRLFSRVVNSNESLRQRPGRRVGVQLDWLIDQRSTLNWRLEYTANTFDSSVPTGNLILPSYLRTDVSYVFQLQKSLRLSAAIDNVFDRKNQSYIGALASGRRVRLVAVASF